MRYISHLFGVLVAVTSFSVWPCNCGHSIENYYGKSQSVHLIEVTSLELLEDEGQHEIRIGFNDLEALTANNFLPKSLFLKPGGCTPSLMPGFKYIVFIPKEVKTTLNEPKKNAYINKCTGIIELGYLNHPQVQEQYNQIKNEIRGLE
ncbi:hypothetical protein [Pseudoalteromonas xiamenensis]